ncbi:hypothetical protein C0Q70_12811 [Pomacea canaliculata]|uniref:Peptidase M1 membrane alanine aminopeptidase domain-containing protein n=1 Tax=Pomacea canaliculata TaxID=400727 RepID=A0A2T7P2K4_POMCA|nr:hypothetical protein C0Q70_12811 [Pomacea canaliculata]
MAELVMDYYNDYFTLAFPLPEQGQDDFNLIVCLVFELIALPGFQYAGMEHWGLVSYSENSMLLSEEMASINDKEAVTRVIAHETAHMWFGDLLTMAWWDDTWLNEGFATFVEYLGTDYASPQWKMIVWVCIKRKVCVCVEG